MKIALFGDVALRDALHAANHTLFEINVTTGPDLAGRAQAGPQAYESLRGLGLGALLDCDGRGLLLVPQDGGGGVKLLHELLGIPLISEFSQLVPDALACIPPEVAWTCLASRRWFKIVHDPDHAAELKHFGVPGVLCLPPAVLPQTQAAADLREIVLFTGDAPEAFMPGRAHLGSVLRTALQVAEERRVDVSRSFMQSWLACGLPQEDRGAYFTTRRLCAALSQLARDHALLRLKRELGDRLCIHGKGWKEVHGLETADGLAGSRALISLVFAPPGSENAVHPAIFRSAAHGSLILTQRSAQLADCFELGAECDTFDDEGELIEKCRHYLQHPERARRIGEAGRQRCLRDHTPQQRLNALATLDPALHALGASAAAPFMPQPRDTLFAAAAY